MDFPCVCFVLFRLFNFELEGLIIDGFTIQTPMSDYQHSINEIGGLLEGIVTNGLLVGHPPKLLKESAAHNQGTWKAQWPASQITNKDPGALSSGCCTQ